ncbi:MAG TPA: UDP-N-acetylglucosamine--N-acetylmuramyl-(pentapeptide) pyrophosphoryl-undecaprenol N-acetylglucosamine transferase [Acidimicrobiia bacterium]
MTQEAFALITGGGTGGHVYPALAVADELVRRGHDRAAVRFVGSRRGLEATSVPAAGYGIALLPGRGVRRSLRPADLVANIGAVVGLVAAFARAIGIVTRPRPRVVFGVGGYASAACIVAARLRRVPAVVHEQNAAPGLANRLAVRLGARAAVSLPDTPLRGAVVTGNPVRREIVDVAHEPSVAPRLVVVVGGSLGARTLNDAAVELYARWRNRSDVRVHHVTGRRDFERCLGALTGMRSAGDVLDFDVVAYDDDIETAYARASVFVCRAGAVTCAELTVTGMPALLVPLPGAPADHQTRNAEALAAAGAAVVVPDAELGGARLDHELTALLDDGARLERMSTAARTLGRPDAAARVADLVEGAAAARSSEEAA